MADPSGNLWTAWGTTGDIPVPGDYDGDADTDIASSRPASGNWFVHGGAITSWGVSGDVPVPRDYDGDTTTDVAVFRPSQGTWLLRPSMDAPSLTAWGTSGDRPLPLPPAVYKPFFAP